MRTAAVACLLVAALGGCSFGGDDDGDDDAAGDDEAGDSGCAVEPGRVGALLGYDVVVADDKGGASSCRFEPVDAVAGDHPGASVVIVERRLAEGGFPAALAAVESAAGPVEPFGDGELDGADRGWVARVGRVVQVGAARESDLVQVTVADAALDAAGAEAIALDLASEALG